MNQLSDLVNEQANEHGDEGIIDAQRPFRDEEATDAACHGTDEPCLVGSVETAINWELPAKTMMDIRPIWRGMSPAFWAKTPNAMPMGR
jgi:hypothetical protein